MTKVKIPYNKIKVGHPDYSETVAWLAALAVEAGGKAETKKEWDDYCVYYTITHTELLDKATAQFAVSEWGEVLDYPVWIEVGDLDDDTPAGLVNSEGFDMDWNSTGQKTWSEWMWSNYTAQEKDSKFYVPSNSWTGRDLPLSDLMALSLTLKDTAEYKTLFPPTNPE